MSNEVTPLRMNQFLDGFDYEAESGELALDGVRYLCLQPTLLLELQKSLESELPYDVKAMITQAASVDAVRVATRLREVFAYPPEQVLGTFALMLSEAGWGATRVEMFQPDMGEVVMRVDGSPFANDYGPSINPVCLYTLGMLQGVVMAVFDLPVDGQEVQCSAKGDTCCRFAISVVREL